jgi:hypothetical protein
MNDLDNLDTKSYSLSEFCVTAKRLLGSDNAAEFVCFVLCGRYQDHQAIIDAYQNVLHESYTFKGLRDYDSLLGINKDIVVRTSLTLYPLARKEDTLKTNIHLDYSFNIPGVSCMTLNQEMFHLRFLL